MYTHVCIHLLNNVFISDVSAEIKNGAPLLKYESKDKQQIQNVLDSNITTVWEVAWPYAGIMGREGW